MLADRRDLFGRSGSVAIRRVHPRPDCGRDPHRLRTVGCGAALSDLFRDHGYSRLHPPCRQATHLGSRLIMPTCDITDGVQMPRRLSLVVTMLACLGASFAPAFAEEARLSSPLDC